MTFTINRASDYSDGIECPCEGATLRKPYEGDPMSQGVWTIEIESLQNIMDLISKVGKIVIEPNSSDHLFDDEYKKFPCITIYDDYLE